MASTLVQEIRGYQIFEAEDVFVVEEPSGDLLGPFRTFQDAKREVVRRLHA